MKKIFILFCFVLSFEAFAEKIISHFSYCELNLPTDKGIVHKRYRADVSVSSEENGPLYVKVHPNLITPLDISKYEILLKKVSHQNGILSGSVRTDTEEAYYTKSFALSERTVSLRFVRIKTDRSTTTSTINCAFRAPISLDAIYTDLEKNNFIKR